MSEASWAWPELEKMAGALQTDPFWCRPSMIPDSGIMVWLVRSLTVDKWLMSNEYLRKIPTCTWMLLELMHSSVKKKTSYFDRSYWHVIDICVTGWLQVSRWVASKQRKSIGSPALVCQFSFPSRSSWEPFLRLISCWISVVNCSTKHFL